MSFARIITAALVVAAVLPVTAAPAQDRRSPDAADPIPSLPAQDRRSPDAADPIPSLAVSVQRNRTAPDTPQIAQDLRSPDSRDVFVAPSAEAPSAAPNEVPWLWAGAIVALAMMLLGLTLVIARRHRVAASA
jgi:hypothetical protein